jgi:hypothetical protein
MLQVFTVLENGVVFLSTDRRERDYSEEQEVEVKIIFNSP